MVRGGEEESAKIEERAKAASMSWPNVATLQDHFGPAWICSQSGFNVGSMIVEKGITDAVIYAYSASPRRRYCCMRHAAIQVILRRLPFLLMSF